MTEFDMIEAIMHMIFMLTTIKCLETAYRIYQATRRKKGE